MTAKRWTMGWYNGWSPEERRAGTPVQREAVASGAIPRPTTCSICRTTPGPGASNPVWFHDENYAEPLAAYHVCRRCHRVLHDRFDQPEPWAALVTLHGTGSGWFERLSLDPACLRRPFQETYPDGLPTPHQDPPDGTSPS